MNIPLELIIHEAPDGRTFLNFWDYKHGADVCCEIIEGKIFHSVQSRKKKKEISISEFINLVHKNSQLP